MPADISRRAQKAWKSWRPPKSSTTSKLRIRTAAPNSTRTANRLSGRKNAQRAFIPTMCLIFRIRRAQSMFRIKSTRYPMRKSVLFLTAYSMRCPAEGTSISLPTSRSSRRAKHIRLIKRKEWSDCARA